MDTITFGHDDENDPIERIVLEKQGNKALLLSKYILSYNSYNYEYVNITWENCNCREWLNSDFMKQNFSQNEQNSLLTTDVINNDNYNNEGGNTTKDKLFLLSIDEFKKYFNKNSQAIAKHKYDSNHWHRGIWWLRSPGEEQSWAACVTDGGYLAYEGNYVTVEYGIRPALWVSLSDTSQNENSMITSMQDSNN